jgi:transcriptional regulator of NAD metabolism
MDGEVRRREILFTLKNSDKPISATAFAKKYGVSRQIVVGDIALIRASGEEITATSKGYILPQEETGLIKTIASIHQSKDIPDELLTIVQNGGKVLDVTVDHPIYGSLTGNLRIESEFDIQEFLDKMKKFNATPLSKLTDGVHSHQIAMKDEATFHKIYEALDAKGYIYKQKG